MTTNPKGGLAVLYKNTSGLDLELPTLGLRVNKGEQVEVTGDDAKALANSPHFERVDKPTTKPNEKE